MAEQANSKAAKIRALLAERPDATAKEIIEALAAKKVKVTAAQVYNLKSTSSNGRGGRGRSTSSHGLTSGVDVLIQAKKLADAMGGVDKARAALDVLAKLV